MSKSPEEMVKDQQILLNASNAVVAAGITRFILLALSDNAMLSQFHEMKNSEGINLLINTLVKAIEHELEANPQYTKEYAQVFIDFKTRFITLVAEVNKKIKKFSEPK